MRFVIGLCLVCAQFFGCGDSTEGPGLDGSISSIHPLSYTDIRAQLMGDSVSIEYRDSDGTLVAVTFKTDDIETSGTYAIPDKANIVFNRYSNPSIDLVPTQGQLVLDTFVPEPDGAIIGRFEATVIIDDPTADASQINKSYSVRGVFDAVFNGTSN